MEGTLTLSLPFQHFLFGDLMEGMLNYPHPYPYPYQEPAHAFPLSLHCVFQDAMEDMLRECADRDHLKATVPCAFHSVQGNTHARDHKDDQFSDDPRKCGDDTAGKAWRVFTKNDGPIARALTCAGRLAHTLARGGEPEAYMKLKPWWSKGEEGAGRKPPDFWRRPRLQSGAAGADGGDGGVRWGLFVMSDTPAVMQWLNASEQLREKVVQTKGAFAHNTYGRVCSGKDARGVWQGCERREDPGGGWTRIILDLALASLTDGLVGVPQSTFQDAVHMRSFSSKAHYVSFHYITRPWTNRGFRKGLWTVISTISV
ncbi:hypothetical protein T492DRAFT_354282 [Pavlovales sp. CCMP2436]|nr:hypothetical protein T492DRAFT_354282 [Pavlovales sp. CCMP2436]